MAAPLGLVTGKEGWGAQRTFSGGGGSGTVLCKSPVARESLDVSQGKPGIRCPLPLFTVESGVSPQSTPTPDPPDTSTPGPEMGTHA